MSGTAAIWAGSTALESDVLLGDSDGQLGTKGVIVKARFVSPYLAFN